MQFVVSGFRTINGAIDPPSLGSGIRSGTDGLLSEAVLSEGDGRLDVWERFMDASDLFRTSSLFTGEKVISPSPESLFVYNGASFHFA